jgi:hypothetical protein
MGARTQSRNTLGINHPLAESHPLARILLSMVPFIGGTASGLTQEDIATMKLPKETTLFSPFGIDITDKDLAKISLATEGADWASVVYGPGALLLGGAASGVGLLGRKLLRDVRPLTGERAVAQNKKLLKELGTDIEGKPLYSKEDKWLSEGEDISRFGKSIVDGASISIDLKKPSMSGVSMKVGDQITPPASRIKPRKEPGTEGHQVTVNLRRNALEGKPVISVVTQPGQGIKSTHFYTTGLEMEGGVHLSKQERGGNPRMFAKQFGDVHIDPSPNNILDYILYKGKGIPTQANVKKIKDQYYIPVYKQATVVGNKYK